MKKSIVSFSFAALSALSLGTTDVLGQVPGAVQTLQLVASPPIAQAVAHPGAVHMPTAVMQDPGAIGGPTVSMPVNDPGTFGLVGAGPHGTLGGGHAQHALHPGSAFVGNPHYNPHYYNPVPGSGMDCPHSTGPYPVLPPGMGAVPYYSPRLQAQFVTAPHGARVTFLRPTSPLRRVGIEVGDTITHLDGIPANANWGLEKHYSWTLVYGIDWRTGLRFQRQIFIQ